MNAIFQTGQSFQLWTPQNLYAKTFTTAQAALDALRKLPNGWVIEVFDMNLVSRGVVEKSNREQMAWLSRLTEPCNR